MNNTLTIRTAFSIVILSIFSAFLAGGLVMGIATSFPDSSKKIYTYIYYRTGNVYDAEDLTTNVFIRAMNSLPRYQDRGLPFSSWLYRIAHNLISNWYRDKAKQDEVNLDLAAGRCDAALAAAVSLASLSRRFTR